jgi:hypothetical protein
MRRYAILAASHYNEICLAPDLTSIESDLLQTFSLWALAGLAAGETNSTDE